MRVYTLVLLAIAFVVSALRNISLDDPDPAIVYYGNWLHTPYDPTNKGGHHRVTADNQAYATLAFTGVAIYFYSPLWPFHVTTALSLDEDPPDLVDLRDYDVKFHQDGAETANSSIVWYTDGLENSAHLLNVSVGPGEDLAILDYLVYTVLDPGDPSMAPTSVTHTRSISLSSSPSPSTTPAKSQFTSSSSTKIGLSVTLGLVCIIFTAIVLWAFFWWWKRRHRRRLDELSLTSSHEHPTMSEQQTNRRPSYPRTTGIPITKTRNFTRSRPSTSTNSSRRSALPGKRAGKKSHTLTPIPESSADHLNEGVEEEEHDSESQGSSSSPTASTSSSPDSSLKNDKAQMDLPTVRLVTDI